MPRGLIFETDTYVPLDAVVRRSGTDVVINVPKLLVARCPWSQPPLHETRQEKQGPPAREVEKLHGSRSPTIQEREAQA